MQKCGAMALPIVSLISFLVGITLAYSGAIVLRRFGGDIWVADLIGVAMTREMGAMMAGIVLAGRTGAAYAAEIGSMKANEEIDALMVLGISPVRFLVLPRVIALGLMMPLLALYANCLGILGGMAIAYSTLDIPPTAYWVEMLTIVDMPDVTVGVIKSVVYGLIVGLSGCLPRAPGRQQCRGRGPGGDLGGRDGDPVHHRGGRALCRPVPRDRPVTMDALPAIDVTGLACAYDDYKVLEGVSFRVSRAEIFFIVGGTGVGKTTLLRNMVGLAAPVQGEVRFNGRPSRMRNGRAPRDAEDLRAFVPGRGALVVADAQPEHRPAARGVHPPSEGRDHPHRRLQALAGGPCRLRGILSLRDQRGHAKEGGPARPWRSTPASCSLTSPLRAWTPSRPGTSTA